MGWKASMLIINKPATVDHEKVLHDLGFVDIKPIGEKVLELVINPNEGEVHIATYKDNLIICEGELPMHYMDDSDTPAKTAIAKLFPSSEVCSLVLHSTVNLWGYAVSKNGEVLRARAGAAETGVIIDAGKPLEQEQYLLSKATLHADGSRTFVLDDDSYTDDQVGENFVFAVSRRYLGQELDHLDDLLFETKFAGYAVKKLAEREVPQQSKASEQNTTAQPVSGKGERKGNRWWIYALIIVAFFAWQIFRRVVLH